jgi:hypothetical protein
MLLMTNRAHLKYTMRANTKYARRYQSSAMGLICGSPMRGRLPRIAPPTNGVSMTVQYGKGCRVRWARIILVVILPKTNDIVRQKRTRWLSGIKVEYGEYSQAPVDRVKTTIGVHSRKTGRTGRFAALRAFITFSTQNGRCAPNNETTRIGTQRSLTEYVPKNSWYPKK